MKLLFSGTPDFSVAPLQALIDAGHEVLAVLTQPDRPAGRGRKLQASAVKHCALENNIEVLQPVSLKEEAIHQTLKDYHADVMVVVAYGIILPQAILDIPKYGCLNIHGSLLPRWRGAAPIHRAIESGDTQTGVSIMQMDAGLDTGDVLFETTIAITENDTTGSLHDKLSSLGAQALLATLKLVETQSLNPVPQTEDKLCYAHKISKAEAKINWNQSSLKIHNAIRAFNPWPVAHTTLADVNYRIWEAAMAQTKTDLPPGTVIELSTDFITVATADGAIQITKIQAPGKKAMAVKDFSNNKQTITEGSLFL